MSIRVSFRNFYFFVLLYKSGEINYLPVTLIGVTKNNALSRCKMILKFACIVKQSLEDFKCYKCRQFN
jgi:hypothetical protein